MNYTHAFSLFALFAGAIGSTCLEAQESVQPALEHTREEFNLIVTAPYEQAFPLFGAYEERKWATGFNPQFIHPSPARDQPWMVFTTESDGMSSIWTNTAFDPATGHVQCIYFAKDTMVTLIDIHLAKAGAAETHVSVVYERTALCPEGNEQVTQHARDDGNRGNAWAEMINGYLAKVRPVPDAPK